MSETLERLEWLRNETILHPLSEARMTVWLNAVDDHWDELIRLARLGLASERQRDPERE